MLITFANPLSSTSNRKSKYQYFPKTCELKALFSHPVCSGIFVSSHFLSDAGGARNSPAIKENAGSHLSEKSTSKAPLAAPQDSRKNETSSGTR